MVVPKFFSMISEYNEYRIFEEFNTPMDILQDILIFDNAKYLKGEKNIEFNDLLIQSKELDGIYQINSANAIYKIVSNCGRKINGLKVSTCSLNEKAKKTVERKSKKEAIEKLKKLNPNDAPILSILKQGFGKFEDDKIGFKKYAMLTLNLLFLSKKIQVLKCFINNNMDFEEVLIKIKDNYDFNFFGNKYQKVTRKELNI